MKANTVARHVCVWTVCVLASLSGHAHGNRRVLPGPVLATGRILPPNGARGPGQPPDPGPGQPGDRSPLGPEGIDALVNQAADLRVVVVHASIRARAFTTAMRQRALPSNSPARRNGELLMIPIDDLHNALLHQGGTASPMSESHARTRRLTRFLLDMRVAGFDHLVVTDRDLTGGDAHDILLYGRDMERLENEEPPDQTR